MLLAREAEHEKKHEGREHVQPYRVYIIHPVALDILFGKQAGVEKKIFQGDEELGIVMRDILEKMADEMAEGFFCFHVLLPAMAAKAVRHFVAAVQAVLFFSEMLCFQSRLAGLDSLRYRIPGKQSRCPRRRPFHNN